MNKSEFRFVNNNFISLFMKYKNYIPYSFINYQYKIKLLINFEKVNKFQYYSTTTFK